MERRIWMFPQYTAAMADALRLRSALLPYTYTAAADAAERTSIATMHPMYYEWPTEPLAYNLSSTQYLFGPALLASPISNSSGAAMNWSTWLPPLQQQQQWCSFNGTECWEGGGAGAAQPTLVTRLYGLGDLPLFARSGAIMPMQTMASVTRAYADPLVITVWPFAHAQISATHYSLYEDDGEEVRAAGSSSSLPGWRVPITATPQGSVTVGAAQGTFAGAPPARALVFRLRGACAAGGSAAIASVSINGQVVPPGDVCSLGCWRCQAAAQHSLLAPEGTLVVESPGRLPTGVNNTMVVVYAA